MRTYSRQAHLIPTWERVIGARSFKSNERPEPQRIHKLDHRLDEATKAQVVATYVEGLSALRTGERFGLSKRSVLKLVKEAGEEVRPQGVRLDHAERRRSSSSRKS